LYQYEKNIDISLGSVLERIAGKISELAGNFSDTDLKELKEISDNNWRAYIETGLIGTFLGATPAYIAYYVNLAISLAFKLFILFIIFNICVIIHNAIQKILDACHTVIGGVKNVFVDANDFLNQIGIKFEVPGINIPAIRFSTPPLFKLNWFPFTNSLIDPINKITAADEAVPRQAMDVIINMIRDMLAGLIDLIPTMLEGLIDVFEKIMK
jgi:hypothetical protein